MSPGNTDGGGGRSDKADPPKDAAAVVPPAAPDVSVRVDAVPAEVELPPASEAEPRKPLLSQPTFEDGARREIALLLIWILAGLLVAAYVTTWIVPAYTGAGAEAAAKVREEVSFILQQAVGPLITLIGTVCGFYFGRRKGE